MPNGAHKQWHRTLGKKTFKWIEKRTHWLYFATFMVALSTCFSLSVAHPGGDALPNGVSRAYRRWRPWYLVLIWLDAIDFAVEKMSSLGLVEMTKNFASSLYQSCWLVQAGSGSKFHLLSSKPKKLDPFPAAHFESQQGLSPNGSLTLYTFIIPRGISFFANALSIQPNVWWCS